MIKYSSTDFERLSASQVFENLSERIRSGLRFDEGVKIWTLTQYFSSNPDTIIFNPDNIILSSTWTFKVQEIRGRPRGASSEALLSHVREGSESIEVLEFISSLLPQGIQKTKIQEINPKPAKNKICLISDLIFKK